MLVLNPDTHIYEFKYTANYQCETIGKVIVKDYLQKRFNTDVIEIDIEKSIPNHPDALFSINGMYAIEIEFKSACIRTKGRFSFTKPQIENASPGNRIYAFIGKGTNCVEWIVLAKFNVQDALKANVFQCGRGKTDKCLRPKRELLDGIITRNGSEYRFKRLAVYMKTDINKLLAPYKNINLIPFKNL